MKKIRKEKIGDQFNNLTIIDFSNDNKRYALCKCSCGETKIVETYLLSIGRIKSCGCARRIIQRDRNNNPILYGKAIKKELRKTCEVWSSMLKRCLNKNNNDYKYYGGKKITVCDKWLNFYGFLEDMGKKPEGTFLDRIDSNKNYEYSNCRWATREEQLYNKTNSFLINYKGKKYNLMELSKKYNINRMTLKSRLLAGWDIEKALKIPVNKKTSLAEYKLFFKNKIITIKDLLPLTYLSEKELFNYLFIKKEKPEKIIKLFSKKSEPEPVKKKRRK